MACTSDTKRSPALIWRSYIECSALGAVKEGEEWNQFGRRLTGMHIYINGEKREKNKIALCGLGQSLTRQRCTYGLKRGRFLCGSKSSPAPLHGHLKYV